MVYLPRGFLDILIRWRIYIEECGLRGLCKQTPDFSMPEFKSKGRIDVGSFLNLADLIWGGFPFRPHASACSTYTQCIASRYRADIRTAHVRPSVLDRELVPRSGVRAPHHRFRAGDEALQDWGCEGQPGSGRSGYGFGQVGDDVGDKAAEEEGGEADSAGAEETFDGAHEEGVREQAEEAPFWFESAGPVQPESASSASAVSARNAQHGEAAPAFAEQTSQAGSLHWIFSRAASTGSAGSEDAAAAAAACSSPGGHGEGEGARGRSLSTDHSRQPGTPAFAQPRKEVSGWRTVGKEKPRGDDAPSASGHSHSPC